MSRNIEDLEARAERGEDLTKLFGDFSRREPVKARRRKKICKVCNGSGRVVSRGQTETCDACDGGARADDR